MKDLFFQTSFGAGSSVCDSEVRKVDYDAPELYRRFQDLRFTIFVFGNATTSTKSVLFCCRNLISHIDCTYVGKDRDCLRVAGAEVETAASFVDSKFGKIKEFVVINSLGIDAPDDDAKLLLSSLYAMIWSEVTHHYGVKEDIVVCIHVNEEELDYIKTIDAWGSKYSIDEEHGMILLYL